METDLRLFTWSEKLTSFGKREIKIFDAGFNKCALRELIICKIPCA